MRAFSVATGGSQDPRAAFWQVTDPQKWPFPSLSQHPHPWAPRPVLPVVWAARSHLFLSGSPARV